MAIASFRQITHGSFSAASSSLTLTFSSGTAAGSCIVVYCSFDGSSPKTLTISNGSGDAITDSGLGIVNGGASGFKSTIQAFFNPAVGTTTVTATWGGAGANPAFGGLAIYEITGLGQAPQFDQVIQNTQSTLGTAATAGTTGILRSHNEAAICCGSAGTHYTLAGAANGWVVGQGTIVGSNTGDTNSDSNTGDVESHQLVTSVSPLTGSATLSAPTTYTLWVATIAPGDLEEFWFDPLSEPSAYQIEPGLSAAWTQYHTGFFVPPPAPAMSWFSGFSNPVPIKPRVLLPYMVVAGVGSPTPSFSWFSELSNPAAYLLESGLSAAWTQYHTGFLVPAPFQIFWFNWLSEPVKEKPGLKSHLQQPFTTDWKWSAPTPPPTLTQFWFNWLGEPVRVAPSVVRYQQPFTTDWKWSPPNPAPTLTQFWFNWLTEPVRSKQAVAFQQPFTVDWRWVPPTPAPDLTQFWLNQLSEPVRIRPAIAYQHPFTTDSQWSSPSLLPNWYQAFSEPPRLRGIPTALHQSLNMDWVIRPTFFPTWYEAYSEPQRSKLGLWAANQQYFAMDRFTHTAIFPTITYTISVTESGDTSSLIFIDSGLIIGANVTVIERHGKVDNTNVTIIEVLF